MGFLKNKIYIKNTLAKEGNKICALFIIKQQLLSVPSRGVTLITRYSHEKDPKSTKKLLPNLEHYISVFQNQVNATCRPLIVLQDFECEKSMEEHFSCSSIFLYLTEENYNNVALLVYALVHAHTQADTKSSLGFFFFCSLF